MRSMQTVFHMLSRLAVPCLVIGMLSACSGTPAAPATPAPITVALASFSLTPSAASAKAGDVTFVVTNTAPDIKHEFVVIKSDLAADKLPVGSDQTVDEAAVTAVDEVPELDPGASGTLTVNLAAGHYVLICNVAGHYQAGMHTDFTVNP
jgi:uncharacterized cupredoxin-like copper-binding protein